MSFNLVPNLINSDNYFNTSRSPYLAEISEYLKVPVCLRNAVDTIRELEIKDGDEILVEMCCENNPDFNESVMFWAGFEGENFWFSCDWIIDQARFKSLKRYHNYGCFDIAELDDDMFIECCDLKTADIEYAMLFLTDYFQFLNPKVKTEDIQVDITLNPEPSFDE